MPAVYRRVLRRVCLVQQADQLVQAGGQDDDDKSDGSGPAFRSLCATPAGTSTVEPAAAVTFIAGEPEAQRPRHHMPRLVIGVVNVKEATSLASPSAGQSCITRLAPRTCRPGAPLS